MTTFSRYFQLYMVNSLFFKLDISMVVLDLLRPRERMRMCSFWIWNSTISAMIASCIIYYAISQKLKVSGLRAGQRVQTKAHRCRIVSQAEGFLSSVALFVFTWGIAGNKTEWNEALVALLTLLIFKLADAEPLQVSPCICILCQGSHSYGWECGPRWTSCNPE